MVHNLHILYRKKRRILEELEYLKNAKGYDKAKGEHISFSDLTKHPDYFYITDDLIYFLFEHLFTLHYINKELSSFARGQMKNLIEVQEEFMSPIISKSQFRKLFKKDEDVIKKEIIDTRVEDKSKSYPYHVNHTINHIKDIIYEEHLQDFCKTFYKIILELIRAIGEELELYQGFIQYKKKNEAEKKQKIARFLIGIENKDIITSDRLGKLYVLKKTIPYIDQFIHTLHFYNLIDDHIERFILKTGVKETKRMIVYNCPDDRPAKCYLVRIEHKEEMKELQKIIKEFKDRIRLPKIFDHFKKGPYHYLVLELFLGYETFDYWIARHQSDTNAVKALARLVAQITNRSFLIDPHLSNFMVNTKDSNDVVAADIDFEKYKTNISRLDKIPKELARELPGELGNVYTRELRRNIR